MKNGKHHSTAAYSITRKRAMAILFAFAFIAAYLFVNLFRLQYSNYDYYRARAYDQVTVSSALKANRGIIYDANMNPLATNKTVWRVFVSTRDIKQAEKRDGIDYTSLISENLSKILSLDEKSLEEKLRKSKVLDVTVKKAVTEEEYGALIDFITKYELDDLVFTEAETTRYYPSETMAAHALGFVGSDNQGLYGLEYYYNSTLAGKDGYYLYAKDANGNTLPGEYEAYQAAEDGYSLVTTIDSYIQQTLESELERIRLNHSVENRVCGIVMDTKTGAILAMATSSPFNPNSPYELDETSLYLLNTSGLTVGSNEYKAYKAELMQKMWANKPISETYEPGSTFKIVTVSSALDLGAVSVNDTFSCHGYYSVGGWRIRCHKITGHGSGFDLAYGLQMSCNPTMMMVAEKMGAESFYSYIEKFSYFEKTGIDLPSEASTIFHKPENIGKTELATISFGQRFKVTPIRHLTSLCAIANGGYSVTPYVVSKIIDKDGNTVKEHESSINERVISKETADKVFDILEAGVSGDGGAKNAYVEGYKVAAKTGTSQKFDVLDENGNSYLRIGSTVAFAKNEEAGIAAIIIVDEPMSSVKYGSVVAAPYISSLFTNVLPYLEFISSSDATPYVTENFVGLSVNTAVKKLTDKKVSYEIIGSGSVILSQTPEYSGERIYTTKILLFTEKPSEEIVIVPSVIGKSAAEANEILTDAGLCVRFIGTSKGTSKVFEQSLTPGASAKRGDVVTVSITSYEFED